MKSRDLDLDSSTSSGMLRMSNSGRNDKVNISDICNILVIKHGALGDFILAQSAFAAIRRHHRDGTITLLTTAPVCRHSARVPLFRYNLAG